MLDWVLYQRLVTGLPSVWPSGLVLTWALFLTTVALATPVAYGLACLAALHGRFRPGIAAALTLVRGVPPLILIFAIDFALPLDTFAKAIMALTAYSVSHLFPVFGGFVAAYPAELRDIENIQQIGWVRRHLRLRLYWVAERSFPAVQTHLVSLFKDTSIVIVIGMLDMAALAKLLASRAYDLSAWIGVFGACAVLYLANVQAVNAACNAVRRFAFAPATPPQRAAFA